jgi:single-strand DNA-binding protein
MFGNVNKVTLCGRLGADPEIRSTNSGKKVAQLSVATTVYWTKDGQKMERTEWHRVVVFNERFVPVVEKVCQKGTHVYLEAALQTRSWKDSEGKDRFTTEVVIQNFQGDFQVIQGGKKVAHGQDGDPGPEYYPEDRGGKSASHWRGPAADLDDEIPF